MLSYTTSFSAGWMWLELLWLLEHGTCPLAAGGQKAQILKWPKSTAVPDIFHPEAPNLTSNPPCAPHTAQLTAPTDPLEVWRDHSRLWVTEKWWKCHHRAVMGMHVFSVVWESTVMSVWAVKTSSLAAILTVKTHYVNLNFYSGCD